MHKQFDLILSTMKKHNEEQQELQIYLVWINYNINNLEKGIITD